MSATQARGPRDLVNDAVRDVEDLQTIVRLIEDTADEAIGMDGADDELRKIEALTRAVATLLGRACTYLIDAAGALSKVEDAGAPRVLPAELAGAQAFAAVYSEIGELPEVLKPGRGLDNDEAGSIDADFATANRKVDHLLAMAFGNSQPSPFARGVVKSITWLLTINAMGACAAPNDFHPEAALEEVSATEGGAPIAVKDGGAA